MKNYKAPLPTTKVTWTYAVTVKWIRKKEATTDHYQEWLANAMQKQFRVTDYWFEFDSCNRLHLHGVAEAAPNYFKKRLDFNGYHRHVTRLIDKRDVADWIKYCKKDQPTGALLDLGEMERDAHPSDQDNLDAVEEYELCMLKQ